MKRKEKVSILFPARLLWDKGIRELRDASDQLKEKYKDKIQFIIAGHCDKDNKAGVSESYMSEWQDNGYVTWLGNVKNMLSVYQESDIVILPSYREGLPKSLIEACAVGRAIITTNAPGCRDCVDDNGIIVSVKDSNELAEAIKKLIDDEMLRDIMGKNSRKKAEKEFDLNMVVKKHIEIYNKIIKVNNESIDNRN